MATPVTATVTRAIVHPITAAINVRSVRGRASVMQPIVPRRGWTVNRAGALGLPS